MANGLLCFHFVLASYNIACSAFQGFRNEWAFGVLNQQFASGERGVGILCIVSNHFGRFYKSL